MKFRFAVNWDKSRNPAERWDLYYGYLDKTEFMFLTRRIMEAHVNKSRSSKK